MTRIQNSRPSFSLHPMSPETSSRSANFHSQGNQPFDDRFLVEETCRKMGWSFYPLRKAEPSAMDKEDGHNQPFDERFLVEKTCRQMGWSFYPLRKPSAVDKEDGHSKYQPVSQRLEGRGRKSNLSTTNERGDGLNIARSIVLALPAVTAHPEQAPLNKRKTYRKLDTEKNKRGKEKEDAHPKRKTKTEVKNCRSATGGQEPHPNENRKEVKNRIQTAEVEGIQKRKRGRPPKGKIELTGTSGVGRAKES